MSSFKLKSFLLIKNNKHKNFVCCFFCSRNEIILSISADFSIKCYIAYIINIKSTNKLSKLIAIVSC